MKILFLLIACLFMLVQIASTHGLPGRANSRLHSTAVAAAGSQAMGTIVVGNAGRGSAANQLNEPNNFFFDQAGNLYVADLGNNRIQKFAPGAISGITVAGGNGFGSAANQFAWPTDVRMDAIGNLYITDELNNRVQKWAPGATTGVTVAGGNGPGILPNQLSHPAGLFIDAAGNLYVSDQFNNRIQKFAPGATSGVTVTDYLSSPNDVFVDASGNIYVADDFNHRIQKFAPGSTSGVTVAGGNGPGDADNQFNHSDGIFVDPRGNMYISDFANNRVVKWAPGASSGVTIAGGNGAGTRANQLNGPVNVFVDASNNLYVSEAYNDRIFKFAADPLTSCLPDLLFTTPTCNGTAIIKWTVINDTFPTIITIPEELDISRGQLNLMGVFNGHGYYKSALTFSWPVARDVSFYIGDTSVNGHLVTIGSAAENNFILSQLKNDGGSPWIGFYNTGKQGQFAWVNGEPVSYTNWAPNEPNNSPGIPRFIKEPYVRIMDGYGTWNDQRSDKFTFITEFDEPLIRYKQTAGPANGSAQSPGTYQVCYEVTNSITGEKNNCCFNVTVSCTSSITAATNANSERAIIDKSNEGLRVKTSPNPSNNYFKLQITGSRSENGVDVTITDVQGRVVEIRKGIKSDQLQIGERYRPGVYVAEISQGGNKVMIRVVKQ